MTSQIKESSFIRVSGYKSLPIEVKILEGYDDDVEYHQVENSGIFEPIAFYGSSYQYNHQKIEIIFKNDVFFSVNNYDLRHTEEITFRDVYKYCKYFLWDLYTEYETKLEGKIFDKGVTISGATGEIGIVRSIRSNQWKHDLYFKNKNDYGGDMTYKGTFGSLSNLKDFLTLKERYKRYVTNTDKPLMIKDFYRDYGNCWNDILYEELIKYTVNEIVKYGWEN
tara:strand:- start:697 stop:1365 length:669 start_codon:yes stop_codon:yes gene_type:complete